MNRNTMVRFFVGCLVLLLLHAPAHSKTVTVEQDGSGDYTTIAEALTAIRGVWDTIVVGPGVYNELLYIECSVTILSSDGPEATILDGGGIERVIIFQVPLEVKGKKVPEVNVELSGFTISNCFADNNGGAVRVDYGTHVTMQNCIFRDNVSNYAGAAIFMRRDGSSLTLSDCEFIDNYGHEVGAISIMEESLLEVDRCTFIGNSADVRSACIYAWDYATANISNSVFLNNSSQDISGGIAYSGSVSGTIQNNTFYGNDSPGWGTIYAGSYNVTVTGNIIAGEKSGYGLVASNDNNHTCNLFWDNELGDLYPELDPDPTEIFEDPLFCDPGTGDLSIAYESPAAPSNNDCGVLIGALEPACHADGPSARLALGSAVSEKLALHQNSPNPFNPSTRIAYYLPESARVTIDIYDVQGRLVSRLVDRLESRGEHVLEWNGRNSLGRPVGSGVYFCRLTMGREILTRKMLLLR